MLQEIKIENEFEFKDEKTLDFYNTYKISETEKVVYWKKIKIRYIFRKKIFVVLLKKQYQVNIKEKSWNIGKVTKPYHDRLKELEKDLGNHTSI